MPPKAGDGQQQIGDDPTDVAKRLLASFEASPSMHLMGGALDACPLYPSDFVPLSKMKSTHELRAEVAQSLKAPLVKTAKTLQAPSLKLAKALAAPTKKFGRAINAHLQNLQQDDPASSSDGDDDKTKAAATPDDNAAAPDEATPPASP